MRRSRRTVDRLTNTIPAVRSHPSIQVPHPCSLHPCTHEVHTPPLSPAPAAVGVTRWGSVSARLPFPILLFPKASMAHSFTAAGDASLSASSESGATIVLMPGAERSLERLRVRDRVGGSEMCEFFTWPENS